MHGLGNLRLMFVQSLAVWGRAVCKQAWYAMELLYEQNVVYHCMSTSVVSVKLFPHYCHLVSVHGL